MKLSTKAALFSGLVFPGAGHLLLRSYLRAGVLIVSSLIALYVVVSIAVRQAMSIVDRMLSGEVPPDVGSISKLLVESASSADTRTANMALLALAIVWLIGLVDAWRLGSAMDNSQQQGQSPCSTDSSAKNGL
jgi:hypothetical protein